MDVFKISVPNGIAVGTFDNTTVDHKPHLQHAYQMTYNRFLHIFQYQSQCGLLFPSSIPLSYQRDPPESCCLGTDIAPGRGVNDGRVRGDNRQHCPNAIRSLVNNAACHCNNSVSVLRQIRSGQTERKNKKMACTLTLL